MMGIILTKLWNSRVDRLSYGQLILFMDNIPTYSVEKVETQTLFTKSMSEFPKGTVEALAGCSLEEEGILPNDVSQESDTNQYPVHTACRLGDVSLLRALINEGYRVNDGNFDLVQPLHEACFNGHVECVRELLAAGAMVDSRNIDGSTPLCDACSSGNVECVKLLLDHGANVNPQLLLSSPLHEAVLRDKAECAELLINAGANLNHTDCHFGTPLHAAVFKGSIRCVKVLLKAGCNVNCIKILDTPLHLAARQQDLDAVSLLLDFGADTQMTNNYEHKAKDMVPSSTSNIKQLLEIWESNPRKLKYLCRQVIRKHLGYRRLRHIDKLKLPQLLRNYIEYKY